MRPGNRFLPVFVVGVLSVVVWFFYNYVTTPGEPPKPNPRVTVLSELGSNPRGMHYQEVSLKLSDGRSVTCVTTSGYNAGISCDWSKAR